jgi:hypothetical protein
MQTDSYKLTRGKLHRVDPTAAPLGYRTFKTGEVFVPTDEELRIHRSSFEGPIVVAATTTAAVQQPAVVLPGETKTLDEVRRQKAESDLQAGIPAVRDVVRTADRAYLEVLLEVETQRKPPRVKVTEMIERRLKALR